MNQNDKNNMSTAAEQGTGEMPIEVHPFDPWLPKNARLLMLGTFPPAPKRWCMDWYYPNFQNDMWRIFGHVFFADKNHFMAEGAKTWRLAELKAFLEEKGVAIFDTCLRIRRTKGTASDKDLEVVERADLDGMLRALPECRGVLAAGQLATTILTEHFHVAVPKMGAYTEFAFEGRTIRLYRMPSSSRAYPLKLEKKAEQYKVMFDAILK